MGCHQSREEAREGSKPTRQQRQGGSAEAACRSCTTNSRGGEYSKIRATANGPMQTDEVMSILLVFPLEDQQLAAFAKAAEALDLHCQAAGSAEAAMEAYICCHHDLVVIDHRRLPLHQTQEQQQQQPRMANSLVKTMQAVSHSDFTTFVAVTGAPGSDSTSLAEIIRAGFDLKFAESLNTEACLEFLVSVQHNNFHFQQKLAALAALFAALDACSDAVEITNDKFHIQYVNAAHEQMYGRPLAELLGKHAFESAAGKLDSCRPSAEDSTALLQALRKGREWEEETAGGGGATTSRFAASGTASQQVQRRRLRRRFVPVKGRHGKLQHIVSVTTRPIHHHSSKPSATAVSSEAGPEVVDAGRLNDDPGDAERCYPHGCEGFCDKKSDAMKRSRSEMMGIIRKTSTQSIRSISSIPLDASLFGALSRMAKMDYATSKIGSQSLEAPIHKVINLISLAQENSPPAVTSALDRVLEILHQATDLYSGELPASCEDKIASDYVGGLMLGSKPSDKKRAGHFTTRQNSVANMQSLSEIPEQFLNCLEGDDEWSFDILELERVTGSRPMVYLGMKILQRFNVCQLLQCSEDTMLNWLQVMQDNYRPNNCYHNATHGADVMQSSAFFLERERLKSVLDEMDEVASLLGALVHDLDHPGRTNPFLINSQNRLALLYNDISVLESHHASLAFQLTMRDDRINIFKNLPREEFKALRQSIIDVVLATEMARHFEHVGKFANQIVAPLLARDGDDETGERRMSEDEALELLGRPENRTLIMRVLIKCSDISNQCRPLKICREWSRRISEEYFQQTDEEKARGLPIVMPVFDRTVCNLPQSQISFIDFFLREMFSVWHAFCDIPELMDNMNNNYAYWKQLAEQGGKKEPTEDGPASG